MKFNLRHRIRIVLAILVFCGIATAQETKEKSEKEKGAAGKTTAVTEAGQDVAQDKKPAPEEKKKPAAWKNSIIGGVNFSQTTFSNWAKGGQNSIAWNMSLDSDFKRNGAKWDWVIQNDMSFGMTKQEKDKARTTLDRWDMDVTLAWKAVSFVNPYVSLGLLTQFTKGYDYSKDTPEAKSNFFDPAYITQDIGARVKIKNVFDSHLGIGLKETLTRNYHRYSDDAETPAVEKYKIEAGISSRSNLDATILKKFQIKSGLKLFKPFEKLDKGAFFDVDVNWDTKLSASITKFVVITLDVYVYYDKDVLNKIQVKEVAGIGLKYQFI